MRLPAWLHYFARPSPPAVGFSAYRIALPLAVTAGVAALLYAWVRWQLRGSH